MHRLFNREQSAFDIYPFRSRFRLTWPFADETMFARDEIMKTILVGPDGPARLRNWGLSIFEHGPRRYVYGGRIFEL